MTTLKHKFAFLLCDSNILIMLRWLYIIKILFIKTSLKHIFLFYFVIQLLIMKRCLYEFYDNKLMSRTNTSILSLFIKRKAENIMHENKLPFPR